MKSEFVFKHLDHSDALVEYAEKRMEKLTKHEMKPTHAHAVFSMQRHERRVDVTLNGAQVNFKASATTDDFYASVDLVVDKLVKQLAKKKHRVQDHTHGPQPEVHLEHPDHQEREEYSEGPSRTNVLTFPSKTKRQVS